MSSTLLYSCQRKIKPGGGGIFEDLEESVPLTDFEIKQMSLYAAVKKLLDANTNKSMNSMKINAHRDSVLINTEVVDKILEVELESDQEANDSYQDNPDGDAEGTNDSGNDRFSASKFQGELINRAKKIDSNLVDNFCKWIIAKENKMTSQEIDQFKNIDILLKVSTAVSIDTSIPFFDTKKRYQFLLTKQPRHVEGP